MTPEDDVPEPGSHKYDIQRTRLRDDIDNGRLHGTHRATADSDADDKANEILRGPDPQPNPTAYGPRSPGPVGERTGSGDPGPVIDLRSIAITDGAPIAAAHTKDGDDTPPQLQWADVPEGTAELALLVVDPDAPVGTFLHWLVTGISPDTHELDPASPAGTAHPNGYGESGWGGPQPPVGDEAHRYVFRLYALGEPFAAPEESDPDGLRGWLDDHSLAAGTLTGTYQR